MSNPNSLPPLWRFDFSDYASLGSAFQKFLSNLNLYTLAIYNLVNGGLGFSNMQRAIYSTTVAGATITNIRFANPLAVTPSGVSVVRIYLPGTNQTPLTSAVSAANWIFDGHDITVLNITGLTVGTVYQITLEIC